MDYLFKTNINSEYQMFWITYSIVKICPNAELNFYNNENHTCVLSIKNACLSVTQIQFIFIENQIDYEELSSQ